MTTNRKPSGRWIEPDPIQEARLHAKSVFQTICELRTAQAVNHPSLAEGYELEIAELARALTTAKHKISVLEARRNPS